ncbi:MAG TPA: hypothetical protein VEI03_19335 [Stellaceae bacterium]|nr:hypothetical protein [Stellaceae bacterium]
MAAGAVRFRKSVDDYQEFIFLLAHPSFLFPLLKGEIDNKNIIIEQSDSQGAIIIYTVFWRSPTGKQYQTILHFKASYDAEGVIENIDLTVEEHPVPRLAAFSFVEGAKQALALYLSDKIKEKRPFASVAVRIFNSSVSFKDGIVMFLKEMTNSR